MDKRAVDIAKTNLDEAIVLLVTESDMSKEEIYEFFIDQLEDAYKYFMEPVEKVQYLIDKIKSTETKSKQEYDINQYEKIKEFLNREIELAKYREIEMTKNETMWDEEEIKQDQLIDDVDKFLEPENNEPSFTFTEHQKIYNLEKDETNMINIRSVSANAYDIVVDSFARSIDLDLRQFKMTDNLYDENGADILISDLTETWNYVIKYKIIEYVEDLILDKYKDFIAKGQTWLIHSFRSKHFIAVHSTQTIKNTIQTIFDLFLECDKCITMCQDVILKSSIFWEKMIEVKNNEFYSVYNEHQQKLNNDIARLFPKETEFNWLK